MFKFVSPCNQALYTERLVDTVAERENRDDRSQPHGATSDNEK